MTYTGNDVAPNSSRIEPRRCAATIMSLCPERPPRAAATRKGRRLLADSLQKQEDQQAQARRAARPAQAGGAGRRRAADYLRERAALLRGDQRFTLGTSCISRDPTVSEEARQGLSITSSRPSISAAELSAVCRRASLLAHAKVARTRPVETMIAATTAAAISVGFISFGIWQEWFLSGLLIAAAFIVLSARLSVA